MKHINAFTLCAVLFATAFTSCSENHSHSHEVSADKQAAIGIHEQCKVDAAKFRSELAGVFKVTAQDDSTFLHLIALDVRLQEWSKTLVKLPGTACNHAEGEEHVHDHVAEAALAELSDAELHELQKEIRAELATLICDLKKLKGEEC